MPILNMRELAEKENKKVELLPLGRYPARLSVEIHQRDKDGRLIMGSDDKPLKLMTQQGFEKWGLVWTVLGPEESVGRRVFDSLSFSPRGKGRARELLKALGLCDDSETNFDIQPEHLQHTLWHVELHHEISKNPFGTAPEAKRPCESNGCSCEACRDAAGRKVYVHARVGWSAFKAMPEEEIKKYPPF
jgi:hypothetical protein